MNGAASIVETLVKAGVDVCFANPGTSEMHFVAEMDRCDTFRGILCLFEGVLTGAADGYARMKGKPAVTLLHLGPGFANGLANLHNARRAASPLVNIVGDHATYHAQYDAPLSSDIAGFARPVSGWLHACTAAQSAGSDAARAVHAALQSPGQIATLLLPADVAWNEGGQIAQPLPVRAAASVSSSAIDRIAKALIGGRKSAVLMRGQSLQRRGLEAAARIAAKTGARLLCDTFAPRLTRGAGLAPVERIPYFAEQIVDFLKDVEQLILVGASAPVSFFAYPEKPSWCTPQGCDVLYLSHPHEDGVAALEALCEAIAVPKRGDVADHLRPDMPIAAFSAFTVGQMIARFLPEHAIISDEAATSRAGMMKFAANALPHDHLSLTGGSIGQGMPLATGAAVACPNRKVVCAQGDGGAMYTLQALWTQAREKLDVTTVIFANRSYAILNTELSRVGAGNAGPKALSMLDLHNPELNWISLANGMGVEASRAQTNGEFAQQFESAMGSRGPRLIEAVI